MPLSNPFLYGATGAGDPSLPAGTVDQFGNILPGAFGPGLGGTVGTDIPTAMSALGAWVGRGFHAPAPPATTTSWDLAPPSGNGLNMNGVNINGIVGPESGGNSYAANPRSSATGLGQFLDKTWNDADLKKRAGYANVPDAQWKALKTGPNGVAAQLAMTAAYAQRNSEHWQNKYGTAPTQGQVYGMHFLDGGGFTDLVDKAGKDPSADAAAIFPAAAEANPNIFYKDPKTRKQPLGAAELVAKLQRIGGDIDPFTAPSLQQVDPAALAGMIPNPSHPVLLPSAPVPRIGDVPARPAEAPIDVQGWMHELKQFAPKSFNADDANKGRVGAVLAGLAQGAASADARKGVGNMLAAMGAGAGRVATVWDQDVKAKKETMDEAQRLFELGVARQGLDLGEKNRQIGTKNIEAQWEDQRDKVFNSYKDNVSQWTADNQKFLHDNGLENEYLHNMQQAQTDRARVAIQATEFNTQLTNKQLTDQGDLDLKRFLFNDEKTSQAATEGNIRTAQSIYNTVGLNPKIALENAKTDPVGMNGLQAGIYIAAKNKTAAIGSLAREVVLTGRWDLLPPSLQKSLPMVAKQDPQLAMAKVAEALNMAEADPKTKGSALGVAKALAGQGSPVGTMFMHFAQPGGGVPQPTSMPLAAGPPPVPVGG